MNKAKWNYLWDVLLALIGLLSGISGIVLLLIGEGGYRGGRNPNFIRPFLGLERWLWNDLHTWASIAFMVGVVIHVALHWKWIVCMTQAMLRSPRRSASEEACQV
ncbi:MAG: DUF4405 domain-containing protein [Thermoflexales bacterium]|nr:DUF4405 domain-containing protein [Thermoflexales bacterium]